MSFCAGLLNRTATKQVKSKCLKGMPSYFTLQIQCERVLGHFQAYLLEQVSSSPLPEALHSARLWVSSVIAICALAQLCAGIVLFTFSARANRFRLTSAHWHLLFGFALLVLSLAHTHYCCQFFFTHLLAVAGVYSLLFALIPLPPSGHPLRQFLAISAFVKYGSKHWGRNFT